MPNYTQIRYVNSSVTTINQLFDSQKIVNIKVEDFLNEKNPETGVENREALFTAYTEQQKSDLGLTSAKDIVESTPIYPPAELYVSIDKVTLDVIKNTSEFVQNVDYDYFLSEAQKTLVENKDYIKKDVIKSYPEITVWIWSKSVEQNTDLNWVTGTIINVSDFIESVKISVSEQGGNFQISLPFIPSKPLFSSINRENSTHRFDESQIKKYSNNDISQRVVSSEIHNTFDKETRKLNIANVGASVNDIIFIKYERLKVESNNLFDSLYIDFSALNNEIFDMIGLIDSVETSTSSSEISATISGRDLMKLIIDDGSFFFPNSTSNPESQKGVFQNQDENRGDAINTFNNLTRSGTTSAGRFIETGMIMPYFIPAERTISSVIELLIKTLANIEICPDVLFESYGDKRTKFKKVTKK